MDKLERLLNLTAALLETRQPLRAVDIREKVPGYPNADQAFHRAFERDKDDLREMGIPIVMEPISHTQPPLDGYRIRKDQYYLRDPELEPDELAALHLAVNAVRLDGIGLGSALAKLGGSEPISTESPIPEVALPASPELVTLFDAIQRRRQVAMTYRGEARRLDPYRVDLIRGKWYLTAYDHLRQDERSYRVDRIEGSVVIDESVTFERPSTDEPGIRRNAWELGEEEPVTARMRIDADQAAGARLMFGPDTEITEHADGSLEVSISVVNRDAFRSMVFGFLDHAEVVGPDDLRTEIIQWLEQVSES